MAWAAFVTANPTDQSLNGIEKQVTPNIEMNGEMA